jgi:bacillopeptidase F (M6 metalloprotease family)
MGGVPASTMTVDSPMNGTEVPAVSGGKSSGQTMAIRRLDDHHYSAIVKMNGQLLGTSNGTVSADNKTMTVDSVYGVGGQAQKTIETWVRK